MKNGAEGLFYESLEDICDHCHSNALSKKMFLVKTCTMILNVTSHTKFKDIWRYSVATHF